MLATRYVIGEMIRFAIKQEYYHILYTQTCSLLAFSPLSFRTTSPCTLIASCICALSAMVLLHSPV